MREATAMEYGEARSRPHVEIRYFFGKHYSTTEVSYLGRRIAAKTDILKREKVISTTYYIAVN